MQHSLMFTWRLFVTIQQVILKGFLVLNILKWPTSAKINSLVHLQIFSHSEILKYSCDSIIVALWMHFMFQWLFINISSQLMSKRLPDLEGPLFKTLPLATIEAASEAVLAALKQ